MTDCPNGDMRDLLPDLLHDRLALAVRRDVELHVGTCAECRAELALLRAMRVSLGRGPAVDVAAVAAAIPAYRSPARRAWGGWRAAAAIMILAAGGTSVAVLQRGRDGAVVRTVAAPRELATASGAIGELNDRELSALLRDLESLEALPSVDGENGAGVSSIAPAGTE
ncbi:MAG TPA: zf-HC2 domain-containing protein [Gemmatimonadaceae bacterium]|nr:zf-HC2 domain-containing protein [Gemmatimonadaceae bacterium]